MEPSAARSARLFDPFEVTSVDISVSGPALEALRSAPRSYVPCQVTFTIDGAPQPTMEAGLRLKGRYGSSRPLTGKAALKLKLDFSVPGQSLLGIEELRLNNMVQDPTKRREAVGYAMFRALGVACPRTGYAWVTLNGGRCG